MLLEGIGQSRHLFGIHKVTRKENDAPWSILPQPIEKFTGEFRSLESYHQELSDGVSNSHGGLTHKPHLSFLRTQDILGLSH